MDESIKPAGLCVWCDAPIQGDESRVTDASNRPLHYACGVRAWVGSVGRQQGSTCAGVDDGDPPGLTRREAAKAACDFFHSTKKSPT